MLDALAAADLVVGRAGSSTLAEVDRPRAADRRRARTPTPPATSGRTRRRSSMPARALLVDDEAFDADALLEAAAILDDPARHARMAAAARALGRPGAADAVAELVDRGRRAPAAARGRRPSTGARRASRHDGREAHR